MRGDEQLVETGGACNALGFHQAAVVLDIGHKEIDHALCEKRGKAFQAKDAFTGCRGDANRARNVR